MVKTAWSRMKESREISCGLQGLINLSTWPRIHVLAIACGDIVYLFDLVVLKYVPLPSYHVYRSVLISLV